ncbi:MAG: DUF86 domain-containing protein [Nitrospirota bacterium]|jgi:uncharacterized protein YutE (UPF0331/DUF86 family)
MPADKEKIAKRISEIQAAIDHLRKYTELDVKEFISNDEQVAAAKYHLLIMIEGCISICTHISTKALHKVPEGYSACFDILTNHNIIDSELGNRLQKMTGFRNLLIHQYWEIDNQKVYRFIKSDIEDVISYIKVIGQKYLK